MKPKKKNPKHKRFTISVPYDVFRLIEDNKGNLYRSEYVAKMIRLVHGQSV